MPSRLHLSTVILVAALTWAGLLVLQGVHPSQNWATPFSTVIGVVVTTLTVFDRWAWRLPILHPWFVSQPNVRGTWRGTLNSDWLGPGTNQPVSPIEAYVVIRQTFSDVHLRLFTAESSSESLAAAFVRAPDGVWSLVTVYRNTARLLLQDRSRPHLGGVFLTLSGEPPNEMTGHYWTDRNTKGEMRLQERSPDFAGSFDEARAAASRRGGNARWEKKIREHR